MASVHPADHVREIITAGRAAMGPRDDAATATGDRRLGLLADRHADAPDVQRLLRAVTFDAVAWSNLAAQGRALADLTPQEAAALTPAIEGMPAGRQGLVGLATLAATAISGIERVTSQPFDDILQRLLARATGAARGATGRARLRRPFRRPGRQDPRGP